MTDERKVHLDPADETVMRDCKAGGAVLVTFDKVLREAAGGLTPYQAMDEAIANRGGTPAARSELERLRRLTPQQLGAMGQAADSTWAHFYREIVVTARDAESVRRMRVEGCYTWRAIARRCGRLWETTWGGNQIAGMVICDKAAKVLGQDFMEPPWN